MTKEFWKTHPRPLLALAPMDGYTDSAYRRVFKRVSPEIVVFTEFTSADGLHYNAKRVREKLRFHPEEQPVIAQIFGKNEAAFADAARYAEEAGFAGVDLNMGCPAKKVVRSEHGVALRKNPCLAARLVETVARATKLPVSVKTRLGWESADGLVEFGRLMESAGADLITIHGRTYAMPYKCEADFGPIYALRSAVNIPVIGNGGVVSRADGLRKLGNLDGFMIGQASIGNYWVFQEGPPPAFEDRIPLVKLHAQLLIELKGERKGTLEIRKYLLHFVKGVPGAAALRSRLSQVVSLREIFALLDEAAQATRTAAALPAVA